MLFLKTDLRINGNSDFIIALLNPKRKYFAKISAVSVIILGGMPESWHAFEVSIFMICFWIFLLTQKNEDCDFPLCTSYSQLSMLGWFLYFINAFKTGSFTWIANGWEFLYCAVLRLLTIFERKYWLFFHFIQFGRFKPELFFQWCWFCQKEKFSLFSNFLSRSLSGSLVLSFIFFERLVS